MKTFKLGNENLLNWEMKINFLLNILNLEMKPENEKKPCSKDQGIWVCESCQVQYPKEKE